VKGKQRRMECPKCGKVFFSWRPDDLPGAPVKCYFCGNQFEDEAARRKPPEPPPASPPEPPKAGEPAG
jgi:DNA-directed RNA polymerase subunit RPC12/RpoP